MLVKLPVRFLVTGGLLGLELMVLSIDAAECDEAVVEAEEELKGESVYLVEGLLSYAAPEAPKGTGRSCVINRGTLPDLFRAASKDDFEELADVAGTVIPRTEDCEVFLEPKCEDAEVDSDAEEPL